MSSPGGVLSAVAPVALVGELNAASPVVVGKLSAALPVVVVSTYCVHSAAPQVVVVVS